MASQFEPEVFHAAWRKNITERLAWPGDSGRLDDRNLFYLQLLHEVGGLENGKHLVDLGCGLSAVGTVARLMGMEATLVDDFGGGGGVDSSDNTSARALMEDLRTRLGVNFVQLNFIESPLPFADASVDAVTCFHSLEHWHHSPKRLFHEIRRVLRPGGFLIIATPNAANLRKRIAVPLGRNIGPTLEEWYHEGDPVFRGHVREPVVRDLHRLLAWNQFEIVGTHGRNFIGRYSVALSFLPQALTVWTGTVADYFLRFFPTLCSDIHVIGRKSA